MNRFTFAIILFFAHTIAAFAGVPREIGLSELRDLVATGRSVSLSRVISVVAKATPGEPVDVRMFDLDGLFYRVVVVQASGRVIRVVIDARTGDILADNSPTATRVRAVTTSSTSAAAAVGKSKSQNGDSIGGAANGGGHNGGNGNGGGDGNGNGNGNGNRKN